LGTLLQAGGRCQCGEPLIRPLVVELLTGVLFVWCFAILGFGLALFKAMLLLTFLIVITFIDLEHQLILDRVVVALTCAGVAVNLAYHDLAGSVSYLGMFGGALLGGGVMLLIAVLSRGGMGGGDIKFMAALGVWFGPQLTLLILFLASFIGGLGSVAVLLPELFLGCYTVHRFFTSISVGLAIHSRPEYCDVFCRSGRREQTRCPINTKIRRFYI